MAGVDAKPSVCTGPVRADPVDPRADESPGDVIVGVGGQREAGLDGDAVATEPVEEGGLLLPWRADSVQRSCLLRTLQPFRHHHWEATPDQEDDGEEEHEAEGEVPR